MKSLVIHDMSGKNAEVLQEVIQAWGRVNKVEKCLKRKIINTYCQWVERRVKEVKLPFLIKAPVVPLPPVPAPISIEEANELKKTIENLEKRKGELTNSLLIVVQERSGLK